VYLTQGTADLLSSVTSGWYTAWQAHLIFWVPVLCILANIQTYVPIPALCHWDILTTTFKVEAHGTYSLDSKHIYYIGYHSYHDRCLFQD